MTKANISQGSGPSYDSGYGSINTVDGGNTSKVVSHSEFGPTTSYSYVQGSAAEKMNIPRGK